MSLHPRQTDPQLSSAAPPSPWRRGAARLLDQMLVAVIAIGIGLGTGFGGGWLAGTSLGSFAYFVTAVLAGESVGKRALGLTIEPAGEAGPTLWSAATREAFILIGSVPFAGPPLAAVAWVTIAAGIRSDPAGRAWHDRLGRTVVTGSARVETS